MLGAPPQCIQSHFGRLQRAHEAALALGAYCLRAAVYQRRFRAMFIVGLLQRGYTAAVRTWKPQIVRSDGAALRWRGNAVWVAASATCIITDPELV